MSEQIALNSLKSFDLSEHLTTQEAISEYLTQVLEDGDTEEIIRALGYIAKAKGITAISNETGLGRESLYKSIKPGSKPRFDTVLKIIKALGVKLHAEPV